MQRPDVRRMPEPVRVWLLGGFRVSVGTRIIEDGQWRLRKAAALVKLLSLTPDHRLHREQVMDLLWPDLEKKAASNNLRQTLHAARRALASDPSEGSRYLASKDESLLLCPEGDLWVDVDAFQEAVAIARRSLDPATSRAAIELYTGDLLPEDRYEEWAEGRRENLRQTYLALLIELAGLYEERGQYELAIVALRKAVAEEPAFEEAHADLMNLYALSGRPGEALTQYEQLQEALSRRLDTEPGETTQRLREEIAAGSFSSERPQVGLPEEPLATAKHNLPAGRTSFVGREREMVEVKRALSMTRLLTLTGAGGSGKTRLALEVARDLIGAYPDGVWLVELAPLFEGDLVAQQVAGTLGVPERPGQPLVNRLVDALGNKALLLVVDNCEHLVEAAAKLADAVLDSCPRLRVLATSREPLGVGGETLWQVLPLSVPSKTGGGHGTEYTVEGLLRYEAVRLFVDRARLRLPNFELTQENAGAVARVCRKLDGIPLAIELATARMGALAVEQVAQRLEASLDVLKGASRTATPRQQTLRATLDWSHNLLSEAERAMWRRLSIFAGGWTLEATEAVCSNGAIKQDDILDLLGGLVDKSLVVAGASTGEAVRYRMLRPVRQYAREKLEASGEADAVGDRHAAFYLALAEEAEPELAGSEQRLWVERLEGEHDNMRATLSWLLEHRKAELGVRLCAALWRFWFARGYLSEGIRCMERALSSDDPEASPVRVKALEGIGWLTQGQGDTAQAQGAYEEMLELSQELNDKGNVATALNSLGTIALTHGNNEQARALLEENLAVLRQLEEGNADTALKRFHALNLLAYLALNEEGEYVKATELLKQSLALARKAGDANRVGATLLNLGYAELMQRDHERAMAFSEEALTVANGLGKAGVEIFPEARVNLGLAALGQGEHERAASSLEEALVVAHQVGVKASIINALEGMASLAGARGEATRAAHLWGVAEAAREVTGIALPPGEQELHEPHLASASSQLDEDAWEAALAEGRAMSLVEGAEYALFREETGSPTVPAAIRLSTDDQPPVDLTPREKEIAVLVAKELSNRQIASALMLSEHTVATHVRNILKKLGLRSRTQIAIWFTEQHEPLP
jgi:predicted ATPase/DNA-binding SARP family transcriptional activator/DNA-binding CsgD family transcriptional regulator